MTGGPCEAIGRSVVRLHESVERTDMGDARAVPPNRAGDAPGPREARVSKEHFRAWDLLFRYRGGEPVRVLDHNGLREEERSVVLDALAPHFETVEAGAYRFEWFDPDTLPPLQQAIRRRGPQSGKQLLDETLLALSSVSHPHRPLSDDERRLLVVRDAASILIRELRSLQHELGLTGGPIIGGSSALSVLSREELLSHLRTLDLSAPARPGAVLAASDRKPAGLPEVERSAPEAPAGTVQERASPALQPKPPRDEAPLHADILACSAAADAPAITQNQSRVLQTMARFDPSRLLSAAAITTEMDPAARLSEETVRQCVLRLIKSDLAERPDGDRSGARLTAAGRRLAGKIAD